jgi:hypothetical protein
MPPDRLELPAGLVTPSSSVLPASIITPPHLCPVHRRGPARLIDVGQKARVEIHRDHSAYRADYLREPSCYGAAARSDLAAPPTFTDPEMCKRISGDVVEDMLQDR